MRNFLLVAAVLLVVAYLVTGKRPSPPQAVVEHTTVIPRSVVYEWPINAIRDEIVKRLGYKPDVAPTLFSWEIIARRGEDDFLILARTLNTPGH